MKQDDDIIRQLQNNVEEHKTIMEKMDKFGESLEEVKIILAELPDKIFERADQRYASKEYERNFKWFIGLIITGFVIALWELIKK